MGLWDNLLKEYDEIVHIPMSSGLSGSCQTAMMLADDYDGKVQVVNNQRVSITQIASIADAQKLIAAGKTAAEVKEVLEKEALQEATGLSDVSFCHKGGFLLTAETLDDAVAACRISLAGMPKAPVLIHIGTDAIDADDALLRQMPGMEHAVILHKPLTEAPELNICGSYAVSSLEKAEWKIRLREYLSDLLKEKPEAVCVSGDLFAAYPVMHQLRKKHIPVLTVSEQNGKRLLIRIPSGS